MPTGRPWAGTSPLRRRRRAGFRVPKKRASFWRIQSVLLVEHLRTICTPRWNREVSPSVGEEENGVECWFGRGFPFPKTPCAFGSEPRLRLLFGSWRRRSVLSHALQVGGSCLDKPPLSWVTLLTANAGPAPRAHLTPTSCKLQMPSPRPFKDAEKRQRMDRSRRLVVCASSVCLLQCEKTQLRLVSRRSGTKSGSRPRRCS